MKGMPMGTVRISSINCCLDFQMSVDVKDEDSSSSSRPQFGARFLTSGRNFQKIKNTFWQNSRGAKTLQLNWEFIPDQRATCSSTTPGTTSPGARSRRRRPRRPSWPAPGPGWRRPGPRTWRTRLGSTGTSSTPFTRTDSSKRGTGCSQSSLT